MYKVSTYTLKFQWAGAGKERAEEVENHLNSIATENPTYNLVQIIPFGLWILAVWKTE